MVKMFVYGDPIIPSKSKESQCFWKHRRQADYYISKVINCSNVCFWFLGYILMFLQGEVQGAKRELKRCLQTFGLSLPCSRIEILLAFSWQLLRQMLHRIWIGKWLSRHTGGFLADGYKSLKFFHRFFLTRIKSFQNYAVWGFDVMQGIGAGLPRFTPALFSGLWRKWTFVRLHIGIKRR